MKMEVLEFLHQQIRNKIKKYIYIVSSISFIVILCWFVSITNSNGLNISIISPKDGVKYYKSTIPVNGTVNNKSAQVTINGIPVVVAENGYFENSADLIKGENTITIIAMDGSQKTKRTLSVHYLGSK
jgi:hypothetical protein